MENQLITAGKKHTMFALFAKPCKWSPDLAWPSCYF